MAKSMTVFWLLLLPGFLFSQTPDTSKVYPGKPVTVTADRYEWQSAESQMATKMLIPLHKTPLSVAVINQKILDEQKATHLTDALKNSSGIYIQQNLGTQDFYLIRGFESTTSGLVLIDGLPESSTSQFQFYGFGVNDLYNIERVEILKGPAAFLYGGNSHSGAVNLIRKQPQFKNLFQISTFHRTNRAFRETLDFDVTPAPNLGLRVNTLWEHTRSFRQQTGNWRFAVNPVLLWRINPFNQLKIHLEWIHNYIFPDFGIPLFIPETRWQLPDVPETANYQSSFDRIRFNHFRLRADFERKLKYGFLLNNYASVTFLDGDSRVSLPHLPERDRNGDWIVNRHIAGTDERQFRFRNQIELQRDVQFKSVRQKLLLGFEVGYLQNFSGEQTTRLNFVYLMSPQNSAGKFEDLLTFQNRIETHAHQSMAAAYLIDYVEVSDRLQLFLGGRFDFQDFHTDRINAPFDYLGREILSQPIPFSDQTGKFSPISGLVWQESANLWFYLNYGQAFGQGKRLVDAPETSHQFEFGYKYKTRSNKITTSATFYSLKKENISVPLQGPLQGGLHTPTGVQRSQGLEFELTAQPIRGSFLRLLHTFTEAELIETTSLTVDEFGKLVLRDFSGKHPAFVPAQLTQLWLHQAFCTLFRVGLGLSLVSPQYVSPDNQFEIAGYATWDLQITYGRRPFEVTLDWRNLTNSRHLTRGFGAYSVIPAELRSVYTIVQFYF